MADRMEAVTLLSDLMDDQLSYDPKKVERLIALLPYNTASKGPCIGVHWSQDSPGITGVSPGIGEINAGGGKEAKSIELNAPDCWRLGVFKVRHVPGYIYIYSMWYGTGNGYDTNAYIVYSDPHNGSNTKILIPHKYDFGICMVSLRSKYTYHVWKLPFGVSKTKKLVSHKHKLKITLLLLILLVLVIKWSQGRWW